MNTIRKLADLGQSVWLDFADPAIRDSGALRRMIEEDGIRGVASSPRVSPSSIESARDHDAVIRAAAPSESDAALLERLVVRDVVVTCDTLRGVYETTLGLDGFAALAIDPTLAHDTRAQVEHATRARRTVDRPNLMVEIPATREAIPAIELCLRRGINVDVTLLFSVARYREVIGAHLRALERRLDMNEPIDHIASVASFSIAPLDETIDPLLDAMPNSLRGAAGALRGQIALANAAVAYEEYQEVLASERWKALAAKGARPQRLLWASSSPKDPAYPKTYYVEQLIGRGTVQAMTVETFRTYLRHGTPEPRVETYGALAERQLVALESLDADLAHVTEQLESESLAALEASHGESLAAIAKKRGRLVRAA